MMTKRFRAWALIVSFSLSILVPVRPASAVVPIVGLAIAAIAPTGAVLAADILTAGVTALIGGTIAALALSPSTADAPVRVPLLSDTATIDKVMVPPTAPSSAQATVTGGKPENSATVTAYRSAYDSQSGWSFGVTDPSLDYCLANFVANLANRRCVVNTQSAANYGVAYGNCTSGCVSITPSTSCPSGYSVSGTSCNLSNPRLAVSDNKSDLTRATGGYSSGGDVDALPSYAAISGTKAVAYGTNSKGEPLIFTVSNSTDGTISNIQIQTQTTAGGQSAIETRNFAINAATGQVTSASSALNSGSLSGVGTGATASTGSAVSNQDIVFPSDYARSGEAANAAQSIKTAIEAQTDISQASLADPAIPDAGQFSDSFFPTTFDGLLNWTVPAHTSQCPTADLSFDFWGHHFGLLMDAHCTIYDNVKTQLTASMLVVWVVAALFIVLGA